MSEGRARFPSGCSSSSSIIRLSSPRVKCLTPVLLQYNRFGFKSVETHSETETHKNTNKHGSIDTCNSGDRPPLALIRGGKRMTGGVHHLRRQHCTSNRNSPAYPRGQPAEEASNAIRRQYLPGAVQAARVHRCRKSLEVGLYRVDRMCHNLRHRPRPRRKMGTRVHSQRLTTHFSHDKKLIFLRTAARRIRNNRDVRDRVVSGEKLWRTFTGATYPPPPTSPPSARRQNDRPNIPARNQRKSDLNVDPQRSRFHPTPIPTHRTNRARRRPETEHHARSQSLIRSVSTRPSDGPGRLAV